MLFVIVDEFWSHSCGCECKAPDRSYLHRKYLKNIQTAAITAVSVADAVSGAVAGAVAVAVAVVGRCRCS